MDHIARIYHDTYEAQDSATGATRPNIMLIIRNFNFAMPNAITEQQHSWNDQGYLLQHLMFMFYNLII